jgi:hypothetical protein
MNPPNLLVTPQLDPIPGPAAFRHSSGMKETGDNFARSTTMTLKNERILM